MLHDPRKTADPMQIDTLISWLECQPPEQSYDYGQPCGCLLAQYFGQHGFAHPYLSRTHVNEFCKGPYRPLPPHFDRIAHVLPHTFGAALARARQFA